MVSFLPGLALMKTTVLESMRTLSYFRLDTLLRVRHRAKRAAQTASERQARKSALRGERNEVAAGERQTCSSEERETRLQRERETRLQWVRDRQAAENSEETEDYNKLAHKVSS